MNPFTELTDTQLQSLRAAFLHGPLKYGVTVEGLRQQGLSLTQASQIDLYLKATNLPTAAATAIIEAIRDTRTQGTNLALAQTLVITGPSIAGNEILKTGSRFMEVIQHAKRELMLATFALHQGDQILVPIYEAMLRNPDLEVTLIVNIPRKYRDQTLSEEVVEAYRREFLAKHWKWSVRPKIYYYAASLALQASQRASMHSKFVLADEERCFITSANFTEAAQMRNIEVGVELLSSNEPRVLSSYFKTLIRNSLLERLV